jgi:hypothetical protein
MKEARSGKQAASDDQSNAYNDLHNIVMGRGVPGAASRPYEVDVYSDLMAREATALSALDAVAAREAELASREHQFLHRSLMQVFATYVSTFNEILHRLTRVRRAPDLLAIVMDTKYHIFFGITLTIVAIVAHIV